MKHTYLLIVAIASLLAGLSSSCKDYSDELNDLYNQIEGRMDTIRQFNQSYDSLKTLVDVMNGLAIIDKVIGPDSQGRYIIKFKGEQPDITLENGKDGLDGQEYNTRLLSVKDSTNGKTYWVINGDWVRDEKGSPIEVVVIKGKDGNDAKQTDPTKMVVPLVSVRDGEVCITYDTYYDPSDGTWHPQANCEWKSTGVKAKGEKGDKGDKGGIYNKAGTYPYYDAWIEGNYIVLAYRNADGSTGYYYFYFNEIIHP